MNSFWTFPHKSARFVKHSQTLDCAEFRTMKSKDVICDKRSTKMSVCKLKNVECDGMQGDVDKEGRELGYYLLQI